MIIVDTSVWIEYFRYHEEYVTPMSGMIDRREALALPWIFAELLQGARDAREVRIIKGFWSELPKPELKVCENAWIRGGEESQKGMWQKKGVGLIDAAIFAAALLMEAKVWTLDRKLKDLLLFRRLYWAP